MSRAAFVGAALLLLSACSFRNVACGLPKADDQGQTPITGAAAPEASTTGSGSGGGGFQIAFLGDSVTAGLGLLSDEAYPAVLQRRFASEGYANVETVNAGASGDTTAGGMRRVSQTLGPGVRILVVALGANDALRGLTLQQTHDNLNSIIEAGLGKGVSVLLCGMEAPTNYGEDYRQNFHDIFVNLLREHSGKIAFMPFLLEGVAGNPALNQADGIHPTAEGARIIADQMYPKLRAMVDQIGGG